MNRRDFLAHLGQGAALLAAVAYLPAMRAQLAHATTPQQPSQGINYMTLTPADWKARLTPEQYRVLREHGTEKPNSSALLHEKRQGTFVCAGCQLPLYASETKYESGTGWPSFYQPLPGAVGTREDNSWFMRRTEVHCARCGGHLGHVFNDGPAPTGQRYCMNGVAMLFEPAQK